MTYRSASPTTALPSGSLTLLNDMELFRNKPSLRFNVRYNREGTNVGRDADAIMFRTLDLAKHKDSLSLGHERTVLHRTIATEM